MTPRYHRTSEWFREYLDVSAVVYGAGVVIGAVVWLTVGYDPGFAIVLSAPFGWTIHTGLWYLLDRAEGPYWR